MMPNHTRLTRIWSTTIEFLSDVSQDAVLLFWRKDAGKKMRVPKLLTLRSGREKSPPQFAYIHLQQCLPALRVILGHMASRSLQFEEVPRLRTYPAILPFTRSHVIKHDLEPSKSLSIHPVLMVHLTGPPRLSPIWMHGL
jgi:hypothetical protein